MKMTFDQIELIARAIGIVVALIITFIVKPLIDSKISQIEQEKLFGYIKKGVECANQIFSPEECEEKKMYVLDYVAKILEKEVNIKLDYPEIETLIEGFVIEAKKGWK